MTRWMMLCIAACSLIAGSLHVARASRRPADPPVANASRACVRCHPAAAHVLEGPMATRARERAFAHRAFGVAEGDQFFAASCSGCHVRGCDDCHGAGAHPVGRPSNEACLRCHNGYSVGWQYEGKAPREDHERYRRGSKSQGEPFLRMLPDVHFERGLACGDCHPMSSLHQGGRARTCIDCHPNPSTSVPEHSIAVHLTGMECVACHAAWAPQEYGTFLIRARRDDQKEAFAPMRTWGQWRKSSHLKRQDAPPLGVNRSGRVAPIRPHYILFATDTPREWENRLLAAEWRAFAPHTVRRGTVPCGGCHDNPRRFVLEPPDDRLYRLDEDGLPLRSWWDREQQTVINGSFIAVDRHVMMNRRTPEYAREVVRQWQMILDRDAQR